jgi:hypothetical protein
MMLDHEGSIFHDRIFFCDRNVVGHQGSSRTKFRSKMCNAAVVSRLDDVEGLSDLRVGDLQNLCKYVDGKPRHDPSLNLDITWHCQCPQILCNPKPISPGNSHSGLDTLVLV